jgi:hypothetical protein
MTISGLPLASGEFLLFPEKILVKIRQNVIILTSMGYFYLTLYYRKGAGLDKMDFCCIWTEDISGNILKIVSNFEITPAKTLKQ